MAKTLVTAVGSAIALSAGAIAVGDYYWRRQTRVRLVGIPTASGQKTTLSQCEPVRNRLSQQAKAFAMKFPFDVKAILPIGG